MIKLKNILNEDTFFNNEILSEDVIYMIKLMKIPLNDIYKKFPLWKSMFNHNDRKFLILNSAEYDDFQDATYYKYILNESENWKGYPNLKYSISAFSDKETSMKYSNDTEPYMVLPLSKSSKGVIFTQPSLKHSFKMLSDGSHGLEDFEYLINYLKSFTKFDKIQSYYNLINLFDMVEKNKNKIKQEYNKNTNFLRDNFLIKTWMDKNIPFKNIVEKAFSPEFNNFKFMNYYSDYGKFIKFINNEVVLESKRFLLIKSSEIESIINGVNFNDTNEESHTFGVRGIKRW